jgi:demethylmenaquinone methyltransferase/2-methoxy-6-polyprenyl-1,4-benzoquinol methylase
MNRREFFNSMAGTWDERCRYDHYRINEILDMLPIRKGDDVLDVGTGTGILIPFLLERIGEKGTIIAVDMAEKMIEIAQKKYCYDNLFFIADNVFTAGLPEEVFDLIICYSVFPHFDDQAIAVKLLARYLKIGGTIAICHSRGREEINRKHENASPAVANDHLPPATVVEGYLEAGGCGIETLVDTKRLYVLTGRKRAAGRWNSEGKDFHLQAIVSRVFPIIKGVLGATILLTLCG